MELSHWSPTWGVAPWRTKAPGRRGARPAMQRFGADAGLDPGDAAGPGRG